MVNVKVKTATATATATAHKQLKKTFYKRPTGPTYPSMGLPGGEKGSAVAIHRQRGTCVRACVGMPGVCVLRVCVRERGEAGTRTFRRDWLQSLPRICKAPARAGVEGGYSLPRCFYTSELVRSVDHALLSRKSIVPKSLISLGNDAGNAVCPAAAKS